MSVNFMQELFTKLKAAQNNITYIELFFQLSIIAFGTLRRQKFCLWNVCLSNFNDFKERLVKENILILKI